MIKKDAFELILQYISGWKYNNLAIITSALIDDCIIIESHGPTYHGIGEIELWFKFWLESNSKVLNWQINSFYFCEQEQIAFCEWDFFCVSNDVEYTLPGISTIKFSDQKIAFIQEYRMTKIPYKWRKDRLISD